MNDLDGHLEAAYEDRFTPDYEFQDFDEAPRDFEDFDGWYGPDPTIEDEGEPFDPERD